MNPRLYVAWIALAALPLGGCVGTLVESLAKDEATLRLRLSNPVYGVLEVDRSNVQGGLAESGKDGLRVDTRVVPQPLVETGTLTVVPSLRVVR